MGSICIYIFVFSKICKLLFVLAMKFCTQKAGEPSVQVKNIKLNF
jgi:hypothetical protein